MEEDIKILEEFVKYYEEEAISIKFRGTLRISVDEDDIQAIENIIAAYKDQKCKADIQDATIKNMQDFMEQLEKELELDEKIIKGQEKTIEEQIEKIEQLNKEVLQYQDLEDDREQMQLIINELRKDSIPKVAIREKIEELEREKRKYDNTLRLFTLQESFVFQVEILEKLLGGSNE